MSTNTYAIAAVVLWTIFIVVGSVAFIVRSELRSSKAELLTELMAKLAERDRRTAATLPPTPMKPPPQSDPDYHPDIHPEVAAVVAAIEEASDGEDSGEDEVTKVTKNKVRRTGPVSFLVEAAVGKKAT